MATDMVTAENMRKLSNNCEIRKLLITEFLERQDREIEKSAKDGKRRALWYGDYTTYSDIQAEMKVRYERLGFVIKDPHEYNGGVLQKVTWIYW